LNTSGVHSLIAALACIKMLGVHSIPIHSSVLTSYKWVLGMQLLLTPNTELHSNNWELCFFVEPRQNYSSNCMLSSLKQNKKLCFVHSHHSCGLKQGQVWV
jgi:hypothetical protein